jgi:hypothetical protein
MATTKQEVIDGLIDALRGISEQTKNYDEYSQLGCVHLRAEAALKQYRSYSSIGLKIKKSQQAND